MTKLEFMTRLQGIETTISSFTFYCAILFMTRLQGIETVHGQILPNCKDRFMTRLQGIETRAASPVGGPADSVYDPLIGD